MAGVMAYVANALTTMDYECIQHASGDRKTDYLLTIGFSPFTIRLATTIRSMLGCLIGAISSFCSESMEAESVCEQLLTEPLVYSVKQDHLRFYRELEPDTVQGIKMRAGHMIEVRREERLRSLEQADSIKQMDQLHEDLNTAELTQ